MGNNIHLQCNKIQFYRINEKDFCILVVAQLKIETVVSRVTVCIFKRKRSVVLAADL